MHIQGYECNKCRANFEDIASDAPSDVIEIKCHQCGDTDVSQSEAASEFLELIREMGRTGG